MTVFSVHHTTTYRYKKLVRPGRHQILFRPRDSFDQRLLDSSLTVTPDPAEVRWIHDVFGNCVALVEFAARTEILTFESVIRLIHRRTHLIFGSRTTRDRTPSLMPRTSCLTWLPTSAVIIQKGQWRNGWPNLSRWT